MLSQLYIENIAVIEKAQINFRGGFSVLTGETGAGKSIIVDSIHVILGERASKNLIRTGARSAFVSAVFVHVGKIVEEKLNSLGYKLEEDGSLMLQREISADSKSSCRINGRPAAVSVLKDIGPCLVNIHGQHESYGLLSPENHITYLDRMGLPDELFEQYQKAYHSMLRVRHELDSLKMDETQKARQIDLLTYQIGELEKADLRPGEQEELDRQKTVYRNSEKITQSVSEAKAELDGDDDVPGAVSSVSAAAGALEEAEKYLPEIHDIAERLRNISYDLEDCSEELRNYTSQMDYDPSELDRIEARLDALYRLGLKYGGSVEKMMDYLESCKKELAKINLSDETIDTLRKDYKRYRAEAERLASDISAWRVKTAKGFQQQIRDELLFLNMPNVTFQVDRQPCDINTTGIDQIEFLISANAGEPARSISKIASGGELSRIMLAIKTVLAGRDSVGTLIFDEIDTGISGRAAQKVGQKLLQVSRDRQVVCVTHLAQIASLADEQYLIQKTVREGKTFTEVTCLEEEGRIKELARIMGGEKITPLMLENAKEMLKLAKQDSKNIDSGRK